ncbi:MAG: hypothetical protein ABEJ31_01540 [Haloarculaceae archaeon]
MQRQVRPAIRDKYREAQFYLRRMERADDGHAWSDRERLDADEFRYHCSAFCSAVAELHDHAAAAAAAPAFGEWADDDRAAALRAVFDDLSDDRIRVEQTWSADAAAEPTDGETVVWIGADGRQYAVARDALGDATEIGTALSDVGDADAADGTVGITALARAYLSELDAWLWAVEGATDEAAPDPDADGE